ncbi:hypothetical protein [Micromonospora sp. CPCC 206061]|uniref:hypothetical protein n=1 Tax=Micromonospora sp. CPCC 206061 TaxID=3122410 RepID=UPI002FF029B7
MLGAQQDAEVADLVDVLQFVGVDDGVDRLDLTLCAVECHDADELAVRVEGRGAGLAVDRGGTHPHVETGELGHPCEEGPCDAFPAVDRSAEGGPPSPCNATSWARSVSSARRSPRSAAAKKC